MEEKKYLNERKLNYLYLTLAAFLLFFSNGRWIIPLATWFAPVFLIKYLHEQTIKQGIVTGMATIAIVTAAQWWSFGSPGNHFGILDMALILKGLAMFTPYIIYRIVSKRSTSFITTLVFPAAFTTVEYLIASYNPAGDATSLAYSQYGNLPLLQLLSLTGMSGIIFLITWLGSVVNWAWIKKFNWESIQKGVGIYSIIIVTIFLFGGIRLLFTDNAKETIKIASITEHSRENTNEIFSIAWKHRDAFVDKANSIHQRYFKQTIKEAKEGAKLIFWAELGAIVPAEKEKELYEKCKQLADENNIYLGVPFFTIPKDYSLRTNKLVVFNPDGVEIMNHIKYGGAMFDGIVKGNEKLQSWEMEGSKLSGFICWDMDFPKIVKQAGQNDIDIMIVPGLDWWEIDPMHTQMSVFRAIENGFSMVRQSANGLSLAVDPYGRVISSQDFFKKGDRYMVSEVPTNKAITLYPFLGDYIAWLSILFLIGFVFKGKVYSPAKLLKK